ncbi:MAG: Saccharopine dehydrogenase [Candelina submexicana]|nr:MAG: Saccharopine dehydrogenase [Candelina submexicana]
MKPSAVLSLKSLTSKIHPPLTLNPRESQQLLSLLTSSFRQQLDHEHSSFRRDGMVDVVGKERGRPDQVPTASSSLADLHVQSILTNPLFSLAPKKRRASSPNRSILNTSSGFIGFDSAQRIFTDPMGWFDEQFALGTATAETAAFCLDTHQKTLRSSPDISIAKSMRASGAGSRVLRWMGSTGLTKSNEFLSNENLIVRLVPYLVAEERQAVIWGWLSRGIVLHYGVKPQIRSNENVSSSDVNLTKDESLLLLQLVKAELNLGGGINAALTQFLRSVQERNAVNDCHEINISRGSRRTNIPRNALTRAGNFLVSVLTPNARAGTPSLELFDRLSRSVEKWAAEPTLSLARLQAYHPTKPDPTPSLCYFKSLPPDSLPVPVRKRKLMITLLLETARLLLENGKLDDANWLMNYTGAGFAQELGLQNSEGRTTAPASNPKISLREEEVSNLQLLEGIDLRCA